VTVLTTEDVLRDEAREIHGHDLKFTPNDLLYREMGTLNSSALCLSGGGIRSAAFALGVIQAFASHPRPRQEDTLANAAPVACADQSLLTTFHYISTVSGGGYIGSWLSAWRLWEPSFRNVWKRLIRQIPGAKSPISWLRSYTNYLTPKVGALSPDTWASAALVIRNLLLNWLVIVTPILALVLFLKMMGTISNSIILWERPLYWKLPWPPSWPIDWNAFPVYVKIIVEFFSSIFGLAFLILALVTALRNRPGFQIASENDFSDRRFLRTTMLWSLISAILLVHCIASDLAGNLLLQCEKEKTQQIGPFTLCLAHALVTSDDGGLFGYSFRWNTPQYKQAQYAGVVVSARSPAVRWNMPRYSKFAYAMSGAVLGAIIYSIAWLIVRPGGHNFDSAWTVSGATYGFLLSISLYVYLIIPDEGVANLPIQFLHLVFLVPWLLLSQVVAEAVFVGGSSYATGSEADREWFGRSSGWYLVIAMFWLTFLFIVFFYQVLVNTLPSVLSATQKWIALLAGISGLITGILGKSSGLASTAYERGGWRSYLERLVLPIAATVFSVAVLIISSTVLDFVLFDDPKVLLIGDQVWQVLIRLAVAFLICALVSLGASYFININRFSLHSIYRNRLIRAFLGASRQRNPNSFTGFDPSDNPSMKALWSARECGNWRPFHVINIALNAVTTSHLAWQERKAASFTVTPLHCGSAILGYRDTKSYGGSGGISLGTAMAISGAAVSPNMGYHSSRAVTLLLTMFNIRLGWWLGNPGPLGDKTYEDDGPTFAIVPILQEAFGLTTDTRRYVYLSDGGHFENLGLYEMVRRRCRLIVVSDAGFDPDFRLEDLSNAVRKIAIDLGIEIRFKRLELLMPRPVDGSDVKAGAECHAIGEIDYSTDGAERTGLLLYIKAGYRSVESAGVRGYANANRDFPHQSTANQWFTESQFESYRALGFEITDDILSRALSERECISVANLENILRCLKRLSWMEKSDCSTLST
jgi:hypothetical protein